ncbi:BadF/BadG/BcrA/BcrD ATPase family protein [Defluviimonas salinarum]|uniref:N-acetylglucosamine kinase n=1 Tax=Defluviimonas salinarum TaxID=2992147 RepID=A0ABT3J6Z1_9RHOB|nr:BadF/BadG/BcrA/BcrD ATPase family protein [Defluviimonas salinarum]MCW3783453.1 N-acetylglucosamine kinase [Defluviimonas salinarum]
MGSIVEYHLCAIDGGGTGCRVAIARADGTVVSRASGGPANFATDAARTVDVVRETVLAALRELGGEAPDPQRLIAHAGLAGIMNAQDARALAAQLPYARCGVSDDRLTSAIGVLGLRDGAVLAIGTGAFVAIKRGGDVRFLGGWGLHVGDQASGARLGRELLEHTLLAWDGLAPESGLTRAILARFDGAPVGIVAFAGAARPADYARLAPLVVDAAKAGDAVGRILMDRGAAYLNGALDFARLSGADIICLTGGLGPYYEAFLAATHRERIGRPEGSALDGALQLARRILEETETRA